VLVVDILNIYDFKCKLTLYLCVSYEHPKFVYIFGTLCIISGKI
jgi:hypothetical protein